MVTMHVYGTPTPQGSKKAIAVGGKARLVESAGGRHAEWRNAVAQGAHVVAVEHGVVDVACEATIEFRFPMPKSRPKRVRALGVVPKTTAPDVDKLARAVLDGLQAGGLLADDSLVHDLSATKVEVADGWTGASIQLLVTGGAQ